MSIMKNSQKINPSKDLQLLGQEWVLLKRQSNTDNMNINNSVKRKTDLNFYYSSNQNSFSDLQVYQKQTPFPFTNGQQTFYTGIRYQSNGKINTSKTKQIKSIDNIFSSSIHNAPNNQQNKTLVKYSTLIGSKSVSKTPLKQSIKSSRGSINKSTMMNSIQKETARDSILNKSTSKNIKRQTQTIEVGQNDSNYDALDEGAMLSSIQQFSQNNSVSTVYGSNEKRRRSSLYKNSFRKSSIQNHLSESIIVKKNKDSNIEDKDFIEEQNKLQNLTEETAIFGDQIDEIQISQNYSKNEVQTIINELFQEIQEKDCEKTLEKQVITKYENQRKEKLLKNEQDKLQQVNNTNIVLSYSRGKDIQSNANGFQMSKYLYDQKYGHYKSIPQNYNTDLIQTDIQKACLMSQSEYNAQETKSIPIKSIYNQEIDNNKKYLSNIRLCERDQQQLKIPSSQMMKNLLSKYDKDSKFVVSTVEQQENQNIIQETYGDYLQNPAKRLNISKIKQNQIIQSNLYDSRYVKPFIIEEESTQEHNMLSSSSRNPDWFSPSLRKNARDFSTLSKYHKQSDAITPSNCQTPFNLNTPHNYNSPKNIFSNTPLNYSANASPKNRKSSFSPLNKSAINSPQIRSLSTQKQQNFINTTVNNTLDFSHFLLPIRSISKQISRKKSRFSPKLSAMSSSETPSRQTPIRFMRNLLDTNINSPHAPMSRAASKKKKVQIKTNINDIGKIQSARISSPFVKVSELERGMKSNISSQRQKFYDSCYSPPSERQNNLDRHLMKLQDNKQYHQKLVKQYILLKLNERQDKL